MSRGAERAALAVGGVIAGFPYVLAAWRASRQGWLLAALRGGLLIGRLPSIDDARRFAFLDVRSTSTGGLALVKATAPA